MHPSAGMHEDPTKVESSCIPALDFLEVRWLHCVGILSFGQIYLFSYKLNF